MAQLPRYFRAFDFLSGETVSAAMAELAFGEPQGDDARKALIASESITRLGGDVASYPKFKAALERVLAAQKGTSNYVRLVDTMNLKDKYADLLEIAIANPEQQLGVEAATVLLRKEQWDLLGKAISGDAPRALATVTVLGMSTDGKAVGLLMAPVKDAKAPIDIRRAAAKAMGNIRYGAQELAKLASENKPGRYVCGRRRLPLGSIQKGRVVPVVRAAKRSRPVLSLPQDHDGRHPLG